MSEINTAQHAATPAPLIVGTGYRVKAYPQMTQMYADKTVLHLRFICVICG